MPKVKYIDTKHQVKLTGKTIFPGSQQLEKYWNQECNLVIPFISVCVCVCRHAQVEAGVQFLGVSALLAGGLGIKFRSSGLHDKSY